MKTRSTNYWDLEEKPTAKQLRKTKILEATIDCLLSYGIEGTSFDVVGSKLGMKGAHVIYYFNTKDELIDSVIKHVAATAQTSMEKQGFVLAKPIDALDQYVEANFLWAKKYPKHCKVMIFFYYQCLFKTPYKKLHSAWRQVGQERIQALLAAMPQLEGASKAQLAYKAKAIQALITSYLVEYFTTEVDESLEDYLEYALLAQDKLLTKDLEA